MKKVTLCFIFACLTLVVFSQRFHIGVFGGLAAYNGDLTDKIFPKKVTNGAIGVTGNYELTNNIMLRGGYTYAVVGGADRFSDDASLRARNLAFETALSEFSVVGEYYLLNLNENRISPYAFVGMAERALHRPVADHLRHVGRRAHVVVPRQVAVERHVLLREMAVDAARPVLRRVVMRVFL